MGHLGSLLGSCFLFCYEWAFGIHDPALPLTILCDSFCGCQQVKLPALSTLLEKTQEHFSRQSGERATLCRLAAYGLAISGGQRITGVHYVVEGKTLWHHPSFRAALWSFKLLGANGSGPRAGLRIGLPAPSDGWSFDARPASVCEPIGPCWLQTQCGMPDEFAAWLHGGGMSSGVISDKKYRAWLKSAECKSRGESGGATGLSDVLPDVSCSAGWRGVAVQSILKKSALVLQDKRWSGEILLRACSAVHSAGWKYEFVSGQQRCLTMHALARYYFESNQGLPDWLAKLARWFRAES
eukprot:s3482_g5.t1